MYCGVSASLESPNAADKGSGWLTAWRFQPCPSSSRHAPPPPRSKNGSNVCGAGKPEASYSQGKTPVPNLCDGNTDTAWGDWQSKGSVKPEPWVNWTFDEAKTLDYDLSGSLNIETQAYPRRSRSRSRRMVASSRPRRASPVMAMLASGFLLLIAAVAVFAIRRAAQ